MSTESVTIKVPSAPASEKQVSFLNSLMKSKDNPVVCAKAQYTIATHSLTKGLASEFIGQLMQSPKKVVAPAPVAEVEKPAYGYYDVDGVAFHYDEFKPKYGTTKMPKLFKLTVVKDHWTGKTKGKWGYNGGAVKAASVLTGQKAMTLEEAGTYGLTHGFCIRCGRTLTDPVSVAKGIGPVCQGYWAGTGMI
jgi:Family of unknown function (DUF6011)